ncbi:MAG TPA: triphosphoribosyl-dephospho-CoA synthase [Crenotrichaceae bacterium]|nr:triphosphoribosyl-dephospho-CoA synthase [Crenotrichaceae bacterium]
MILKAWLQACELDILTFKPGNVSVHAAGHNMTAEQFKLSALASAKPITDFTLSLGEKIFYSIQDTRSAVSCNTNLGIVLLCAPLVEATQSVLQDHLGQVFLRDRLGTVLNETTVSDACWVYKAIRLAKPGGLGRADQQDVVNQPQVTLLEAMQLAADKDRIAYQYSTVYKDIFEYGVPRYKEAYLRWGDTRWAALAVYAGFLAEIPDSLIVRKYGNRFTRMVANRMALVNKQLEEFSPDKPEQLLGILKDVDTEFKAAGINPGTTADLTVTSVFAESLDKIRWNVEGTNFQ